MHGLVATCHAKSPRVLPVPVPQLLSVVQLRFCVHTGSVVESFYEERPFRLSINLANRNWLKNLPRQIALYEVWRQLVQEWTIF